jgi:hypothetical protein
VVLNKGGLHRLVTNIGAQNSQPPKLIDQARAVARMRHLSLRTEDAYVNWIRRYISFHRKRHPSEMGEEEISPVYFRPGGESSNFSFHPNRCAKCIALSLSRRAKEKAQRREDDDDLYARVESRQERCA